MKEEQASFRHDLESIAKSDAAAAIANAPAFAATWVCIRCASLFAVHFDVGALQVLTLVIDVHDS